MGSTAHGTGLPGGEDHDELGIVIEEPGEVLGLDERGFPTVMQRTQPEGTPSGPGDTDRTLYSLRRFVRLAASGNPSVLMALWAPVLRVAPLGEELRQLAPGFVGRHVVPRYRGYLQSQAQRLLGLRGGRGAPGDGPGYDTKYAMHAARLGFQGVELLSSTRLSLPMEGAPAEWLRAVRRGEVAFDEWWRRCLDLDAQLARLGDDERLPEGAARARIEAWAVAAHLAWWRRGR